MEIDPRLTGLDSAHDAQQSNSEQNNAQTQNAQHGQHPNGDGMAGGMSSIATQQQNNQFAQAQGQQHSGLNAQQHGQHSQLSHQPYNDHDAYSNSPQSYAQTLHPQTPSTNQLQNAFTNVNTLPYSDAPPQPSLGAQNPYLNPQSPPQQHQTSANLNSSGTLSTLHTEESKRPRACEACRGLKVKCEFDPANPHGPCKRCVKAHRNCQVTIPSRKRQKKTDSRVAELEKKLEVLQKQFPHAQLVDGQLMGDGTMAGQQAAQMAMGNMPLGNAAAVPARAVGNMAGGMTPMVPAMMVGRRTSDQGMQGQQQQQSASYEQLASIAHGPGYDQRPEAQMNADNQWPPNDFQQNQQYPRIPDPPRMDSGAPHRSPMQNISLNKSPSVMAGQKRKSDDRQSISDAPSGIQRLNFASPPVVAPKGAATNEYADVIDRGIVSPELASALFDRYVNEIAPCMPSVVFLPGTTSSQIRKSKPILFLSILSVGAATDHPSLANQLGKEIMAIYGDRIVCHGEKSLELVQALLVSSIWYWPPEHFEEVQLYTLIHLAQTMGIEIGIHKAHKSPSQNSGGTSAVGFWNGRKPNSAEASSVESRRTWVSCYFMCCNVSTGLRRPNLARWSPYLEECVHVLETSPDALPSDRLLVQWVKGQNIMERVMYRFKMDDDFSHVSLADHATQEALVEFEGELRGWADEIPQDCRGPLLAMFECIVNLFMHEIAMNINVCSTNNHPPPQRRDGSRPQSSHDQQEQPVTLSAIQINALSELLTNIDHIFRIFLEVDVGTIRCLPVMHYVRIAYATVMLVKMHYAAGDIPSGQPSTLGAVIAKESMGVEGVLDQLLEKFNAIVYEGAAKEEDREGQREGKSRPGAKFLMVLKMLRTVFQRQAVMEKRKAEQANGTSTDASRQQSQPPPNQNQNQNTPLQLLSEVATGSNVAVNPAGKPDSRMSYMMGNTGQWAGWDQNAANNPGSHPQTPANGSRPGTAGPSSNNQTPGQLQQNQTPAFGSAQKSFDFDDGGMTGMGDIESGDWGGMTGEGDLSRYFGDEAYGAFFKAVMEGAGTSDLSFGGEVWGLR